MKTKNFIISVLFIAMAAFGLNAQTENYTDFIIVTDEVSDTPFESVEQLPEFPGGQAALMSYVAQHIHYPAAAIDKGVQGRVVVRFVIEKDGRVGQTQIVRSIDPDLDQEAVRLIKSLPKFIPGKMNGQNVAVWYTLPINFRLPSE